MTRNVNYCFTYFKDNVLNFFLKLFIYEYASNIKIISLLHD